VVLWERSKKMSESSGVSAGTILGHAMAHELGHLLLHSMEHSRMGIMRSRWAKEDLRRAERGRLLFTTEQAEVMRVAAFGAQPFSLAMRVGHHRLPLFWCCSLLPEDDIHVPAIRAEKNHLSGLRSHTHMLQNVAQGNARKRPHGRSSPTTRRA